MGQKEQIAETFERHVLQAGYTKTNLDDIARELGISKKTIYVHFNGKREIYAHIVAGQAAHEQAHMRRLLSGLPTERAKVGALLKLVIGSARSHITATDEAEWRAEYEIAADAFAQAHGDVLHEIVVEGMAAGEFAHGDVELIGQMCKAMLLEYALMMRADQSYDRDEELVERILRFIG